uniref:Uncharacterized protein n=1 Tax=Rhizophora mucronata TaxID=61149 RepID=A0A2P2P7Q4_RHIMU
MKSMVESNT